VRSTVRKRRGFPTPLAARLHLDLGEPSSMYLMVMLVM
jgi:hypothetical protein